MEHGGKRVFFSSATRSSAPGGLYQDTPTSTSPGSAYALLFNLTERRKEERKGGGRN